MERGEGGEREGRGRGEEGARERRGRGEGGASDGRTDTDEEITFEVLYQFFGTSGSNLLMAAKLLNSFFLFSIEAVEIVSKRNMRGRGKIDY